jgi:hypothetical protein
MMTERLDALTVRESNGKSYFTKIGVAFPAKSGSGFSVLLDAVPASVDGQYKILLMEPKPRDDRQPSRDTRQPAPADLDDDIVF